MINPDELHTFSLFGEEELHFIKSIFERFSSPIFFFHFFPSLFFSLSGSGYVM